MIRPLPVVAMTALAAGLAGPPASPAMARPADPAAATRLHALFDDWEAWEAEQFPSYAMSRGDYSRADRVSDNSLEAAEARHEARQRFLARLQAIDPGDLDEQDLVNRELFELMLHRQIDGHRFRTFLAPMGGRFGPHQSIPQLAEGVRFAHLEDYESYLKRLEQMPRVIDNVIRRLQAGLAEGRTPPRVTLEGVPAQLDALVEGDGLDDLRAPFAHPPAHLDAGRLAELEGRLEGTSLPRIRRSMDALRRYFADTYLPGCREEIAATAWPDGEAYYAHQLAVMTTTGLTAQEIHELGLAEVARIRAEMMDVIRRTDFMSIHPGAADLDDDALFAAFIEYLRTDPRFYHDTPESLLAGYRDICKRIDAWMPKLFVTLPREPYGVRAIPDFMAPSQTTAYYVSGDMRNGEPGYFYANTYALDQRPTYEMVALTLHEAVPGHHHQTAIAREIEDVPEFRRGLWFTAFGEGWALYAERLGIEMGLYEDPYDDFGRLLYEMWRSCRLVVDPGMHAMGWSRQQAIDFMLANTALSPLNVETEVDRYIAWPGQATGYKIGEIKMRELRRRAEERLGEDFDLRAFHDVVLGAGSVPLTVLDRRVDDWINRTRIRAYD